VYSFPKCSKATPLRLTNSIPYFLLIDELDATLHPIAQNKLVDYLYEHAKKLKIQIVFTTHSLSMLEYISQKTKYNDETKYNNQLVMVIWRKFLI